MKLNLFASKHTIPNRFPGIQLERAMFCGNCETVSDISGSRGRCPHCQSESVTPLSGFIARTRLQTHIIDTAAR